MKSLSILGSTGSIGVQSLDVAEKMGYRVNAITANSDFKTIEAQIRKYKPKVAALADKRAAVELRARVSDLDTIVYSGEEGVCACAADADSDTVIDAIVGLAGSTPALAAIESGKQLCLANKEALVATGEIMLSAAKKAGKQILPVDSEHSAIFQCLQGMPTNRALKRLILTASGGPFFGKTREELASVTAADALKHPTWQMGAKITIDSASMFNKGLELIEAHYLFGMPADKIDILVHRQSIVHSLIEYDDNSVLAQLGVSDMRIPIQYALTYPERYPSPVAQLNLVQVGTLTFNEPDYEVFECIDIAKKAITMGGMYPAAINSANEVANKLFREGKISFLDIPVYINKAFDIAPKTDSFTIDDILSLDKEIRRKLEF